MRAIRVPLFLLLVPRVPSVAAPAYYTEAMFWRNQRAALTDGIEVVDREVLRCAAKFAPGALPAQRCAEPAPGWIGVWRRSACGFPACACRFPVHVAAVPFAAQRSAIKAGALEGQARGNFGRGRSGAMIVARCSVIRSVASVYWGS